MNEQGQKFDQGKPRGFRLIPPEAREALAAVLVYGEEKYGAPSGWRDVPNALVRYRDARDRHVNAIDRGETHDPESGFPHSWHVLANDAFLVALEQKGVDGQPCSSCAEQHCSEELKRNAKAGHCGAFMLKAEAFAPMADPCNGCLVNPCGSLVRMGDAKTKGLCSFRKAPK